MPEDSFGVVEEPVSEVKNSTDAGSSSTDRVQTVNPSTKKSTTTSTVKQNPVIERPNDVNYIQFAQITVLILILIMILLIVGYYGLKAHLFYLRLKNRTKTLKNKTFLKIQLADDNEIEPASAEQIFSSFYGIKKGGFFNSLKEQDAISLEIVANQESIDYYAVCPKKLENLVEKQINAIYPDAELNRVEPWNIWKDDSKVEFSSFVLRKANYMPLHTYDDLKTDTQAVLTSAMSKLNKDEAIALQILIKPASDKWQDAGKAFIKKYIAGKNKTDKEGKPKGGGMSRMDEEYLEKINNKITKVGFDTVIRLVSVAPDEASAKVNLTNLERAFGIFDSAHNSFKKAKNRFPQHFVTSFICRLFPVVEIINLPFEIPHLLKKEWFKGWSVLNTQELASLWHMPNKNVRTPRLNWLRSKGSAAPIELPTSGMYLGQSNFRGQDVKIFMSDEDRRRHMYILGTTGTGKSELMKFMAIQDIKAGKGVAFIDPHGSAVYDIAGQIPP